MSLHVQCTDEGHVLAGNGSDVVPVTASSRICRRGTTLPRPDARTASTC
jgi:hypothetical protein